VPLALVFGIVGLAIGGLAVVMALPLFHDRRTVAIGLLASGILCGGWGLASIKAVTASRRYVVLRPDTVTPDTGIALTQRALAQPTAIDVIKR